MKRILLTLVASVITCLTLYALDMKTLDNKDRSITAIAACTAVTDLAGLKNELKAALDAGLTINEINEVLVQMYAYCGFPRSLQAIGTFMAVVEERNANGIHDTQGPEPSPVDENGISKYQRGKDNLEVLTGVHETAPAGPNAFAPVIDTFLKEHLFADIFQRNVLTFRQREIATIAALAATSNVEPMLRSHINMGMNTGLTVRDVEEIASIVGKLIGPERETIAREQLTTVIETRKH